MLTLYVSKIKHNGNIVIRYWAKDNDAGEYLEHKQYVGYTADEAINAFCDTMGVNPDDENVEIVIE